MKKVQELTKELVELLKNMDLENKVESLNYIRKELHNESPFKTEPTDLVLWVKKESVHANNYNPNSVAPTEMDLLKLSIEADGYTQPIVTMPKDETREVIDGFHRHLVGKNYEPIQNRIHGYLPVVTINTERESLENRMASTVRHNRARGKHKVESMSEIVVHLKKRKWSDQKIAKHLGMDEDEVLRLRQITGLSEAFLDREFSEAWEIELSEDEERNIIQ